LSKAVEAIDITDEHLDAEDEKDEEDDELE
jgi:hypothetical protein